MTDKTNIYIPSSAPEPTQNGAKSSAMLNIQKRTVSFRLPSHPSARRSPLVTLLSSHWWIRRSGHQNEPFLGRTADDGSGMNRGLRCNGVVWEILVPNLPPGALRAGRTQLRPAVIAARCKIGNFRAALRPYLGKNETELYLTCFPVVL